MYHEFEKKTFSIIIVGHIPISEIFKFELQQGTNTVFFKL